MMSACRIISCSLEYQSQRFYILYHVIFYISFYLLPFHYIIYWLCTCERNDLFHFSISLNQIKNKKERIPPSFLWISCIEYKVTVPASFLSIFHTRLSQLLYSFVVLMIGHMWNTTQGSQVVSLSPSHKPIFLEIYFHALWLKCYYLGELYHFNDPYASIINIKILN